MSDPQAPELPPLPDLSSHADADDRDAIYELMRDYGRACRAPLLVKLAEKDAEIERLKAEAWSMRNAAVTATERAENAERDFAELSEQMDKAMATFDGMRPVFESNRALRIERDELRAQLGEASTLLRRCVLYLSGCDPESEQADLLRKVNAWNS